MHDRTILIKIVGCRVYMFIKVQSTHATITFAKDIYKTKKKLMPWESYAHKT